MLPPPTIDGARVLAYAWSETPFGQVLDTHGHLVATIHGLALCQYATSHEVYRFSCDRQWQTIQDALYSSLDEAQQSLPPQYRNAPAAWRPYNADDDR
jgi:hypothetical protein